MKRVLSMALVLVMVFTLLPVSALAEEVAAEPAAETEVAEAVQTTVPEEPTEEPAAPSEDTGIPAEPAEAEQDAEEVPAEQEQPEQAASRANLAAAELYDIVARGICGDNLTWALDGEGTLTISGTGEMDNYSASNNYAPWYSRRGSIYSVIIESSVTSIGDYAFYNCSSLESVTIGNSVTSIGERAFYNCSRLTEINYNAKAIADLSNNSNVFYNAGTAGNGIKVTFGDSVEKIPAYLFRGCDSLTSVTIPNSVTSIGNGAFMDCSSLTSVTIGNSVTSIGERAFYHCDSLTSVTIGNGVTSIGADAFYNCSSLTSVTIGNSVTSIGAYAFYYCSSLTEINYNAKAVADLSNNSSVFFNVGTAGDGIKVTFGDSVEKIPAYLFRGCSSLKSVTIPDSVTSIGKRAFMDCSSLTSVTIPDSVTSIGGSAFSGCSSLTNVTIGNSVTSIGEWAFGSCSSLTEINYNAKAAADLTSLSYVFYNAGTAGDGIKVTFGENVKRIPACLFYSYINVREMVFCGNAPGIGGSAFNGVTTTACYPYGNDTWTSEVMKNYGGDITWIPYSDAEATSVICTGTKYYVVGDKLDTSSISVTINRVDGCVEVYNYSTGEIVLGEYDMSKIGEQSIPVTCRGEKTQLDIYVHNINTETMPAKDYPESSHNYENNLDKTYTYVADGAHSLDVTFSSQTETELNVDYIYVNGAKYTGKQLAGANMHIDGDTLEIRLVSDGSDGAYGFSLDNITATYVVHSFTDTVTAPTCTEKGYTTHTCVCGYVYNDSYVDALGHNYNEGICTACGKADPDCAAPAIPTPTISTKTDNGKPTLKWAAVDGAEKYEVYRATSKTGNYSKYYTTTSTSYTNTSAVPGTTYYYKVKAIGANGNASDFSVIKSITCDCAQPVVTISTTASSGKPTLKWSAVDGAAKYEIWRATSSTGTYSKYYTTTSTSYTNSSAVAGSTYYYKVKAICGKSSYGDSAFSAVKSITCDCAQPVPTISTTASSGKPTLKWSAVDGAAKYEIWRATSKDGTYTKMYTTSNTSYTNSSAVAGYTYYYKVKALCDKSSYGDSAFSAVKSITCDCARPVVSITTSSGHPKLSWKAVDGATKYEVYRATSSGGTYTKLGTTSNLSYTNTGAKAGTTYYYKVIAVCGASSYGNSAYSTVVSIKAK